MTPFELDILLHYYGGPTNPPVFDRNPPILAGTIAAFIEEKLLEEVPEVERKYGDYRLTDRGRAYIEHVLAVPLPVVKWVLPDFKEWRGPLFPERHDHDFLSRSRGDQ